MSIILGKNSMLSDLIEYKDILAIGYSSIVGFNERKEGKIIFGSNIKIGNFCNIETDIIMGNDIVIDDYCAIYSNANLGNNIKLLYGKKIFGKSIIGNNCIIGGDIPERCILADNVTFMGEIAHSHYTPSNDWDTTDEPSPTIGEGSIIGVNALLIGGITIGKNCYISAGEILRHDLPDNTVYIKGKIKNISEFKGLITTRYKDI